MAARIHILEDHDGFAALLEKLLTRAGYVVERSADGLAALRSIAAAPPDLLLLDLKVPGLSGIDLLRKLRATERTRSLPVVILTGVYKGEKFAQAARTLGVRHYLEKPGSAQAVLAAVKSALSATQAAHEQAAQSFDRWLAAAFLDEFTGLLTLASPAGAHRLSFIRGIPFGLDRGFRYADIGACLLQKGLATAEEVAYFHAAGNHRPDLFVAMGCFDFATLLQETLTYLSEELIHAQTLPAMAGARKPVEVADLLPPIEVNVPLILLRGAQLRQQSLPASLASQFVARGTAFYRLANFLPLTPAESSLLSRLDGSRRVSELLSPARETIPLLQTLALLGMVTFGPQPLTPAEPGDQPLRLLFEEVEEETEAVEETLESFTDVVGTTELDLDFGPEDKSSAAPEATPSSSGQDLAARVRQVHKELKGKDYYAVFGMRQGGFSFDLLKQRYFALTREFGPETLMQLSGEEAVLVQEILSLVTNAYNTLSEVVKKERYDEMLGSENIGLGREGDDVFQAQVQFQSGKVFLEMEDWESAEKALQEACNAAPQNGEYLANLAWALYRNPSHRNSRAALDKARQLLNRALGLEKTADGFAFKGWMLLEGGQDALAEAEFNKAIRLNARHAMARKGSRQLQEKREQEKKGLFRRMFT